MEPILEVSRVKKHFSGVWALTDANLDVAPGEVHALVGENGAGKSTLVNVISGVIQPDAGEMRYRGARFSPDTPRAARHVGVEVVSQHLSLAPNLTVFENIFLGRELFMRSGIVKRRSMIRRSAQLLEDIGFPDISAVEEVSSLGVSQKYRVEIAKALLVRPQLLILDEPTAALSIEETETLYTLVDGLRNEQRSVIWITHRMEELFRIVDRVTVMRDGQYVDTLPTNSVSEDGLIRLMSGRTLDSTLAITRSFDTDDSNRGLEILGLRTPRELDDVSLHVCAGEIVGVGGLDGSGLEELAPSIMGSLAKAKGQIKVQGRTHSLRRLTPNKLYRLGLFYLPADRQLQGLISTRSVSENVSISSLTALSWGGFMKRFHEGKVVASQLERLRVKMSSPRQLVEFLSGGNQQKVIFARGVTTSSTVFILEEPTQGVDVGAKSDIYAIIRELANEGKSILVISTDTRELLTLCDRILTINSGKLSGEFHHDDVDEQTLVSAYFTKPN